LSKDTPQSTGTPSPHLEQALEAQKINEATRAMQAPDWSSGQAIVRVIGGWTDENGELHNEVAIRAMTGNEEDLLGSSSMWSSLVIELLNNCVTRFGPYEDRLTIRRAINESPSATRMDLLIQLRILSHFENRGNVYTFTSRCSRCDYEGDYDVFLDDLDRYEAPSTSEEYDVELSGGRVARWRRMTAAAERVIEAVGTSKKHRADIFTFAIMVRLLDISGVDLPPAEGGGDSNRFGLLVEGDVLHPNGRQIRLSKRGRALRRAVKGLSVGDREKIRSSFIKNEPGLDLEVTISCDDCGRETKGRIDPSRLSFFFPSSIQKR